MKKVYIEDNNEEDDFEDISLPFKRNKTHSNINTRIYSEEVLNFISLFNKFSIYVEYKQSDHLLKEYFWKPFKPIGYNEERGELIFIWGPIKVGKTHQIKYAVSQIRKDFPHFFEYDEKNEPRPHPYVSLRLTRNNSVNSDRQLLEFFIKKLKIVIPNEVRKKWEKESITKNGFYEDNLVNEIVKFLIKHKVKLFILDEAQRITASEIQFIPKIFERFKDLMDNSLWASVNWRTRWILVGTPETHTLLDHSDFIEQRAVPKPMMGLNKKAYTKFMKRLYLQYILHWELPENWGFFSRNDENKLIKNENQLNLLFNASISRESSCTKPLAKVGVLTHIINSALASTADDNRLILTNQDLIYSIRDRGQKTNREIEYEEFTYIGNWCPICGYRKNKPYVDLHYLIAHMKNKHKRIGENGSKVGWILYSVRNNEKIEISRSS